MQAGFATADFRVLGDAAGHSPDGAHPTLRAGCSPVHGEAATPRRRAGCSLVHWEAATPPAVQAAASVYPGVGDDAESWAIDGVRKLKWYKGQARHSE